jgi:hypothetical protein
VRQRTVTRSIRWSKTAHLMVAGKQRERERETERDRKSEKEEGIPQ